MTDLNRHIDFQMLLDGSADFTMDNLPGVGQLYIRFTVAELEQMTAQLNEMRANRKGFELLDVEVDDVRRGDRILGQRILSKEITEEGQIILECESPGVNNIQITLDGGTVVIIERRIA